LSDVANLHLKVTTHVLDAAEKADGDPAAFVAKLIDRFGAERIMWGSDFCQIHDRPYPELVRLGRRGFAGVTTEARDACLGGTALRLWPALKAARRL
jgi:L-fuconolactonase